MAGEGEEAAGGGRFKSQPYFYLDPQPNAAWLPQRGSHTGVRLSNIARFPYLLTRNCVGHAFSHELPRRWTRKQCSLKLAPCRVAHFNPSGDQRFEQCSVLLDNPLIRPGCSLRASQVNLVEHGRWVL